MTTEPAPPPAFTWEDVQAEVQRAIEENTKALNDQHSKEMDALRTAVAAGAPAVSIPEHAGGPGIAVAPTWCLADQEASRRAAEAELAAART